MQLDVPSIPPLKILTCAKTYHIDPKLAVKRCCLALSGIVTKTGEELSGALKKKKDAQFFKKLRRLPNEQQLEELCKAFQSNDDASDTQEQERPPKQDTVQEREANKSNAHRNKIDGDNNWNIPSRRSRVQRRPCYNEQQTQNMKEYQAQRNVQKNIRRRQSKSCRKQAKKNSRVDQDNTNNDRAEESAKGDTSMCPPKKRVRFDPTARKKSVRDNQEQIKKEIAHNRNVYQENVFSGKKHFVAVGVILKDKNKESIYYPNPNGSLVDKTAVSFVDGDYRYFADQEDAIINTCLHFLFDMRNTFGHDPTIRLLYDLTGPHNMLTDTNQQCFSNEGLTSRKRKLAISKGDFLSGIGSLTDMAVFSFARKKSERHPQMLALRFEEGGYIHVRVDQDNAFQWSSEFHVSRPFPVAQREIENGNGKTELQPFSSIVGHRVASCIQLNIKWMDQSDSWMPMSKVAKTAPEACYDYLHEQKMTSSIRGKIAFTKSIQSEELAPLKGFRETTKDNSLLCLENKWKLVMLKERKEQEEDADDPQATKLEKPLENMTWKEQGAPGCGKCRDVGCHTCYEAVFGPTDNLKDSIELKSKVIYACFTPSGVCKSTTHCEVKNTGMLDCFMTPFLILAMNDSKFTHKHQIFQPELSTIGQSLSLAQNSGWDEARLLLIGTYSQSLGHHSIIAGCQNSSVKEALLNEQATLYLNCSANDLLLFLSEATENQISTKKLQGFRNSFNMLKINDSLLAVDVSSLQGSTPLRTLRNKIGHTMELLFLICNSAGRFFALILYEEHLIRYDPSSKHEYLLLPPSMVDTMIQQVQNEGVIEFLVFNIL